MKFDIYWRYIILDISDIKLILYKDISLKSIILILLFITPSTYFNSIKWDKNFNS